MAPRAMSSQRTHRLKRRGIIALVSVIALTGLVVIAGTALNPLAAARSQSGAATQGARSYPSQPTSQENPQLRGGLAIFRRARSADDRLPRQLRRTILSGLLDAHAGINVDLARLALTSPEGAGLYLIPSRDGVCLADTHLSQHFCATTTQALSGDANAADICSPFLPSDQVEIAGILPDDASNVTLTMTDRTRRALPVHGNAYLARFTRSAALPMTIGWEEAGRHQQTSTSVPPDAGATRCVSPSEVKALVAAGKIPRPTGHPPAAKDPVSTAHQAG